MNTSNSCSCHGTCDSFPLPNGDISGPAKISMGYWDNTLQWVKIQLTRLDHSMHEGTNIASVYVISFSEAKGKYTFFKDNDILFAKVTPLTSQRKRALLANQ